MKIFRLVTGTLTGGVISGLCVATVSWIVIFNSDPGFGVEGPHPAWAHLAAVIGALMGFFVGLPLRLVITLVNQGKIVGTFLGILEGLILLVWGSQTGGHPDIVYPTVPLLISFLPAGAVSGFLTALIVSRVLEEEPAKE